MEQIEKLRVLKSTPIEVVWPFLNYICCCYFRKRQKTFKLSLKNALRHKLKIKLTNSEQRLDDDPYLRLGYGLNSYFKVMLQLMSMMTFIMLFSVPLMFYYASYSELLYYENEYSIN